MRRSTTSAWWKASAPEILAQTGAQACHPVDARLCEGRRGNAPGFRPRELHFPSHAIGSAASC